MFYTQHRPRRRSAGFTLVELLVVVSIIGLLIGILLPALSRARAASRDTECKNNLHQIGIAVANYIADSNGRMPDSGSNGVSGDLATRGLARYFNYTLQSISKTRKFVWYCPDHVDFKYDLSHTSSYGYNWQYMLEPGPDYPHVQWNGQYNAGIDATRIARPSKTLALIEHAKPTSSINLWTFLQRPSDTPDANGMGRASLRHNERANTLFCDGHVAPVDAAFIDIANEAAGWDPR